VGKKSPLLARLVAFVSAIIALIYVAGLRDTRLTSIVVQTAPVTLPAFVAERDAEVHVAIVDEHDRPIPGAIVRLFSIHGDKAYVAGQARAGEDGIVVLEKMPRGEAWLLAYAEGRARGSTRVVLGPGERTLRLVLEPAVAIDVVVVDEAERPFEGVTITATGRDLLPFVATTGKEGKARLDRLGAGTFSVRASARGYDDVLRTGVVPGPVPVRIKLERLGAIEVSVVEPSGQEAPFALVLCAGAGLWPARSTVADEHGKARIAGLRRGSYDLKATLGDRVSATELGVSLERAETKQVRLMLFPGRMIEVTVTDGEAETSPAVKDASVVLVEEGLSPFPSFGRTDVKGKVMLGPIARGLATVSARAEGFVPKSAVFVDEEETKVRVSLLRGGALVGEVVDDRGFPIGGATIEVVGVDTEGMPIDETSAMVEFREDQFETGLPGPLPLLPIGELGVMPGPIPDLPHAGGFSGETRAAFGDPWVTQGGGTFRASPIPPGRVHAIVRHPDYVDGLSETVTIKSGGEAFVKVVLHQGGSLEGRVVDADGRPVPGARVELAASAGTFERVTVTDNAGTFAFAAVPDEVLVSVARAEAPADVVVRLIVAVLDRERKEIEIMLPRQRDAVLVHVTDDRGYPLDRVEVRAVSLDPEAPLRKTLFTDDDGDVEIPDAAGLSLRFALLRPGKAPRVEEVENAPAKITYELGQGLIGRGTVTGRDGREKIAGAEVVLYTSSGIRRSVADENGEFEFKDLSVGRARLAASHPEWARAEMVVAVAGDPGKTIDLGAIDLTEAGEVEGEVVDPNEEPVPFARVGWDGVPTYLPLGPMPPGVVSTDKEGKFLLKGVPEGDATIEAYSTDQGRASTNVKVRAGRTSSRVTITLPGEGSAKGEAKGAGSIAMTLGERTEGGHKVVVVMMVPPNGEAELSGIEPGERIARVNDHEVRTIEDTRRRLSGPLGEDVVLTLSPEDGGKARRLRVRRERVRR